MGYLFLIAVVILLILFTYKHIRCFLSETKKRNETMEQGYYLVSHTYEEKREQTYYYGVFQQGDKELILEMSLQLYLQLQPPQRGMLTAKEGRVLSFEG